MASSDDISRIAQKILRANCRKFAEQFSIPDLRELGLISGIPLSNLVLPDTRASESAIRESFESLASLQMAYNSGGRLRKAAIVTMRAIPKQFSTLIRGGEIVQSETKSVWFSGSVINIADSLSSKALRIEIMAGKHPLLEIRLEKIYKRADWPPPPRVEYTDLYRNIWKIKHPSLRAIRLKTIYKDIFSNERRYRFKIIDSPACEICGLPETVEHHMFQCRNAARIWALFQRITGVKIDSLFDVIDCSQHRELEIIKSSLIKALIQIDRSKNCSDSALIAECGYYLGIEARVSKNSSEKLLRESRRLLDMI